MIIDITPNTAQTQSHIALHSLKKISLFGLHCLIHYGVIFALCGWFLSYLGLMSLRTSWISTETLLQIALTFTVVVGMGAISEGIDAMRHEDRHSS